MQSRLQIATGLFALSSIALGCAPKPAGERRDENATAGAPVADARIDTTAAVAAIRKNDEAFFAAVKARDAKAAAMLYAPDDTSIPPTHRRSSAVMRSRSTLRRPKTSQAHHDRGIPHDQILR